MVYKNSKKGFTLIELLVVIAIIGILSSVVLASLNSARTKANDARRKADIKQLEIALELNYLKHGAYTQPEAMCSDTSYGGLGGCGSAGGTGEWDANSDLRDLITDGFMSVLPKDPINNSTYKYIYEPWNVSQAYTGSPRGQQYDLCARLEAGGSFCINKR
ncbi:MAG: type II secretion system protein [Candidatus Paceibacterota bacterium]|jgi:prepilin-type N-terminal cleavage/methylation domain-containing protein